MTPKSATIGRYSNEAQISRHNHIAMTDNTEKTDQNDQPVSPQELAEVIQEFEKYRERLINDMTDVAKKAKLSKSKLMATLEPELKQIDDKLEALKAQLSAVTNN